MKAEEVEIGDVKHTIKQWAIIHVDSCYEPTSDFDRNCMINCVEVGYNAYKLNNGYSGLKTARQVLFTATENASKQKNTYEDFEKTFCTAEMSWIFEAMQEYARIQIEEDREQCIAEADKSKGPGNIRNLPINLD